jgi:hypothetical protein
VATQFHPVSFATVTIVEAGAFSKMSVPSYACMDINTGKREKIVPLTQAGPVRVVLIEIGAFLRSFQT